MLGEYVVIGIIGSRSRDSVNDYNLVIDKLREIIRLNNIERIIVCSGGATDGADNFAETIAERLEVGLLLHLPNWKKRGKAGGPLRNRRISRDSDYLIACWDGKSKGTSSAMDNFKELGKEERLYIV